MLIKDKKIAIIGGGPAGLTLARLLQMKGADVKVYERDIHKDVRVQGATLDLHEDSGLAALRKAELLEAFQKNYRPGADLIRITDNVGHIYYDQHAEIITQDFGHEHFRPEIDRGPLRNILLESLAPDTVVWNSHIVALERTGDSWRLQLNNNNTLVADIVIAADGANSCIRPFITPIKPFYAGVTIIEGTVYEAATTTPQIHSLVKGGKIFALRDSKTLIVSAKGDGSLAFYTGCKTHELWVNDCGLDFNDHTQLLTWFKEEFASWDTIWHELFNGNTHFTPRPQYCMPLDQNWESQANITMIGDAAHLMPPYAGEGVNMAMQDALELSECLTNERFINLRAAISHYEDKMLNRTSAIAAITLQQTEALHSPQGLTHMLNMFKEHV